MNWYEFSLHINILYLAKILFLKLVFLRKKIYLCIYSIDFYLRLEKYNLLVIF